MYVRTSRTYDLLFKNSGFIGQHNLNYILKLEIFKAQNISAWKLDNPETLGTNSLRQFQANMELWACLLIRNFKK